MLVRIIERTQNYKKQAKGLSISSDVEEKIDSWAKSFTFTVSPRSDMIFRSPRKKVEIWDVRIPNPGKNRGASGGYRMLCFYVADEETMFFDYIQERGALNRGKEKQHYYSYQRDLKGYLAKAYDPR
jgi:hypothetical protein